MDRNIIWFNLCIAPAYFIGNQVIIQRSLGAKDEWNAKASMIFGAFLKILIPILVGNTGS